jgi:hypothetical protein
MTTAILGLSVDTGTPQPNVRVVATPISAAGVNDAAALARQQLATAVPAPAAIAAYSPNIVQQPKPIVRNPIAAPSSSLAAQFIAQGVVDSTEALEIFTPRPTVTTGTDAPIEDDYLTALRVARGDIQAAQSAQKTPATKPSQQATQAAAQAELTVNKTTANAASETVARSVVAQAASGLPALFNQFIRKPTILTTRGLGAYQLAEARNAATRKAVAAS